MTRETLARFGALIAAPFIVMLGVLAVLLRRRPAEPPVPEVQPTHGESETVAVLNAVEISESFELSKIVEVDDRHRLVDLANEDEKS